MSNDPNPRGQGRPPLDPDAETVRITLRLSATDYDRLCEEACALGVLHGGYAAPGTLARNIILRWLKGLR